MIRSVASAAVALALGACQESSETPRSQNHSATSNTTDPSWLDVGAHGRLVVPRANWVYMARSETSMSELIDVQNATDTAGLRSLAQQGKVLRVPNNTNVTVVARSTFLRRVRVTEEGKDYTNNEGWIQAEFVRPLPVVRAAVAIPQYRVLDKVGGYFDILTPTVPIDAPRDSVARIARAIATAEGATEISLYRSEAAFRANFSASYARQNPNALRDGYLGSWKDGRFTPSSYR